jgi:hypothetical protein
MNYRSGEWSLLVGGNKPEIKLAGKFETPSGFGVLKEGWEHRAYLLA